MRKAVILAAGMGTRLRPLTDSEHKCMTKVCGVPIIKQTLMNLAKNRFEEVVIVVGYLRDKLMEEIKEMDCCLKILFAENGIYDQTNTTYSLKLGLETVGEFEELFVIEGDVFFEDAVMKRLIDSEAENATILEQYNEKLEGTFVELDQSGNIIDWRHKSDQEEGYELADKYKTVNLHKFSKNFVAEILIPTVSSCLAANGKNKPFEKVMRHIVNEHPNLIYGEVLHHEKWYEIDDIHDLETEEKLFG